MQHGVNPKLSTNAHQDLLLEKLRYLFPEDQLYENVKKKVSLKFPAGEYMQLDIWVPNQKICFEFQDSYHYVSTWYSHISRQRIIQKDSMKRNQAHARGVDLITIPCWWDGTTESLVSAVRFQRPDLLQQFIGIFPINLNPPEDYFKSPLIPDVGELMLASFPGKYADLKSYVPANTWWLGEKYDGVRFCWNPTKQKVYTRTVKEVDILYQFIALLPADFVEGEMWFGRGEFSRAFLLLEGDSNSWDTLRMNIFDTPVTPSPFEVRYAKVLHLVPDDHQFSFPVVRVHCVSAVHLSGALAGVVRDGGEGIVLRKFLSLNTPGRSLDLVKFKNAEEDSEGIVTGVAKSGTVRVKLPNGTVFVVPFQDIFISPLPAVGTIVSFTYETHWRRDIPLGPKIFRIRTDLSWEDVVLNYEMGLQQLKKPRVKEKIVAGRSAYWSDKRMRLFLERYAKDRNMDPLKTSTWLKTSYTPISQVPGGRVVLEKFKTGYFPTLVRLFPELKFSPSDLRRDYWGDKTNRQNFFEKYAATKGFDPHSPHNWYSQTMKSILHTKGGGVMDFYKFNLPKAIADVFPNIGFDPSKFGKTS